MAKLLLCLYLIIGANNVYANQSCNRKGEECPEQPPAVIEESPNPDSSWQEPAVIESPVLEEPVVIESPKIEEPSYPTCQGSIQERQIACPDGYSGLITQTSTSQCPNPYGQPIFGAWVEIQNSCQMTTSNPMNINSPVSPISPVNPMNAPVTQTVETPQAVPVELTNIPLSPTASESSETKTETKIDVPKGKDLVPGFGLVMSLELLNKPMDFQQKQLQLNIDYTQELINEFRGNTDFLLQLLTDNDVGDSFRSRNDWLWGNLRRHNDLQPCYSCD
jgi:hypothetical protein